MNIVYEALIMIANVVIETLSLADGRFLWGIHIDVTAAIVVAFSLVAGSRKGSIYGLVVGLLLDLFTGVGVGTLALAYFVMGLLCGLFSGQFYAKNRIFPGILAFFAVLAKEAFLMLATILARINFNAVTMLWRYIVPGALLTALVALPVYIIYNRISKSQLRRMR